MASYTDEQEKFLRDFVKGHTTNEITEEFNRVFNTNRNKNQISKKYGRMGLKTGNDGKFKKGHKLSKGFKPTQFKKGNVPSTACEVGEERTRDCRGAEYAYVKIGHPNIWKQKHVLEYEKVHGEVPKGSIVIFLDGSRNNFDIENLKCINRKENLIMNRNKLRFEDATLTESCINIAKLYAKINEIKKEN